MLTALLLSAGISVTPTPVQPATPAAPAAVSRPRAAQPLAPEPSRSLTDEELTAHRGGQTLLVTNQTLAAILTGNSIGDYQAGAVSLGDNALSNFNGLGNFVINTGAQNNLQAGINVTINVRN